MKNLKDAPIFKSLTSLGQKEREIILKEQCILEFYQTHIENSATNQVRALKQRNLVFLEFAEKISDLLTKKNIKHAFIKGIILIEDIYPSLGDRFLSDIDIWIEPSKFEEALENLTQFENFRELRRGQWRGDDFKAELDFSLPFGDNFFVTLELHKKLTWHSDKILKISIDNYREVTSVLATMSAAQHFFYLLYHYSFQHNCQKLYWLFDIILFYKKYNRKIDWIELNGMLKDFHLIRCSAFVKKICLNAFGIDIKEIPYSTILPYRENFMLSDNQRGFYYLALKFLLKDRIIVDSLRYSWLWLRSL